MPHNGLRMVAALVWIFALIHLAVCRGAANDEESNGASNYDRHRLNSTHDSYNLDDNNYGYILEDADNYNRKESDRENGMAIDNGYGNGNGNENGNGFDSNNRNRNIFGNHQHKNGYVNHENGNNYSGNEHENDYANGNGGSHDGGTAWKRTEYLPGNSFYNPYGNRSFDETNGESNGQDYSTYSGRRNGFSNTVNYSQDGNEREVIYHYTYIDPYGRNITYRGPDPPGVGRQGHSFRLLTNRDSQTDVYTSGILGYPNESYSENDKTNKYNSQGSNGKSSHPGYSGSSEDRYAGSPEHHRTPVRPVYPDSSSYQNYPGASSDDGYGSG